MKKYKFKARIEEGEGGGAYVIFPFDVQKVFGTKGRVPVKASFDGIPYSGSLAKYGEPQHILGLLKSIREQLEKEPGDTVEVVVWKDETERKVEVPPELKEALEHARLMPVYDQLSFTHQKEFARWISEAKQAKTRSARLEKAVLLLKQGKKSPI